MNAARANVRREDPAVRHARRARRLRLARRALGAGVLALGAGAGGWWLNQALDVREWTVQAPPGLARAIDHALREWRTRDFWHARPSAIAAMLKQRTPDIARIEVQRHLPHRLLIRASARRAIALWAAPQGGLRLVDAYGDPWRKPRAHEAPDLPLVHAPREKLGALAGLLAALAADPARAARLSEIRAVGHGWQLLFDRGEAWRLPEHDAAERIATIRGLLAKPRWRHGRWRVDARHARRWFVRPAAHEGVI